MRHFLVVLLLCGISQSLIAQSVYSTVTIPSECLPNAHSVIRVHETNCRISQADEAEVEEWMVITILNKEGASNALWVEREDEFVVENVQKGLQSRFYQTGRFSPKREACVHHFHRLLAKHL